MLWVQRRSEGVIVSLKDVVLKDVVLKDVVLKGLCFDGCSESSHLAANSGVDREKEENKDKLGVMQQGHTDTRPGHT